MGLQPEFIKIHIVVAKTSFPKIFFFGNFNAQTSELDVTTGVKGLEVQVTPHQKKKRVAFGLEQKEFS